MLSKSFIHITLIINGELELIRTYTSTDSLIRILVDRLVINYGLSVKEQDNFMTDQVVAFDSNYYIDKCIKEDESCALALWLERDEDGYMNCSFYKYTLEEKPMTQILIKSTGKSYVFPTDDIIISKWNCDDRASEHSLED